jgi:hypothetical protein
LQPNQTAEINRSFNGKPEATVFFIHCVGVPTFPGSQLFQHARSNFDTIELDRISARLA